jgi:muconate cycloisomerase
MTVLDQKIVAMDVWHCQLPVKTRRDHGIGTVSDLIDVVIVRLTSESGETGYGEASPWSVFTGTAEASFAALDRYIRPLVVGRTLKEVQSIMTAAAHIVVHCGEAKAALETALLDLKGRLLGVPVYELLGGAVRDTIPLSVSLANPDFDADIALVEQLRADQVRLVKFKTGIKDHAFDVMRLEKLREDYPEFDIRVDYNQGLAPTDALRKLRDIECFDVTFIEQPVPASDYRIMQTLAAALDTPLLADETVFTAADMTRAIEDRLCNCVSVKIMKCGGLSNGQTIAAIAAAAGMAAYGGDMFETGIAHLAGAHMIAATPNISLGCEFYQATYYLKEDLLQDAFPLQNGHVVLPTGPGLGMEVDAERVGRYSITHAA